MLDEGMNKIIQIFTRIMSICFLCICFALMAAFITANQKSVAIGLWPLSTKFEAQLWILVFIAFCCGLILGALFMWIKVLQLHSMLWLKQKQLNKILKTQNESKTDTKNIPLLKKGLSLLKKDS